MIKKFESYSDIKEGSIKVFRIIHKMSEKELETYKDPDKPKHLIDQFPHDGHLIWVDWDVHAEQVEGWETSDKSYSQMSYSEVMSYRISEDIPREDFDYIKDNFDFPIQYEIVQINIIMQETQRISL